MKININSGKLSATGVQIGSIISLHEISLTSAKMSFDTVAGGSISLEGVEATMILTESALNTAFQQTPLEGLTGLEIAAMDGKLKVKGKYLKIVPIPFTMITTLQIDGGARLLLKVESIEVAGAIPMPAAINEAISTKINDQLAVMFDTTREITRGQTQFRPERRSLIYERGRWPTNVPK